MLCQATDPSSPSLSRGMQQQPPNFQPQPTTPTPTHLNKSPSKAIPQAVSAERQLIRQNSEQKSPRDHPSLESFSQSQLGDDERSESGRTSQENPPSLSSLHDDQGRLKVEGEEQPVQVSATIGDTAPIFLKETPSAASYIGSPNEIQTPRSGTSSNRTPTQATFADKTQLARSSIEDIVRRLEAQGRPSAQPSTEKSPKPICPPQLRASSQLPLNSNAFGTTSVGRHATQIDGTQRFSEESKDTFQTVESGNDANIASSLGAQPLNLRKDESKPQASTRMGALLQSEVSRSVPIQTLGVTGSGHENTLKDTLVTLPRDSRNNLRLSQDYATRGPSIDSVSGHTNPDLPPSPMSPPPAIDPEGLEQRSRGGPVHYGIDYDFIPKGSNGKLRNRSPSYSEPFANRTSQDSRRSLEPNTFVDSAFRQSSQAQGGTKIPSASYSANAMGDEPRFPRQSTAENRPEDVDSAVGRRSESKPRSRRGSRTSTFFKAFGRTSESDQLPLPNTIEHQASSPPVNSPVTEVKKGRRSTILRSLKRSSASGSASGRSKDNVTPTTSVPHDTQPTQAILATSQRMNEERSPRGPPSTTESNRKVQRASTSGNGERDGGKKKRFSAIGVRIFLNSIT